VRVQAVGGIDAVGRLGKDVHPVLVVQLLERAQVGQVEDRSKVDVEALGALPGEHPDAGRQVVDGRRGDVSVVRGGKRPDVARRAGQPGGNWLGGAVDNLGHRVELPAVQFGLSRERIGPTL
jgi:hypothetical protein